MLIIIYTIKVFLKISKGPMPPTLWCDSSLHVVSMSWWMVEFGLINWFIAGYEKNHGFNWLLFLSIQYTYWIDRNSTIIQCTFFYRVLSRFSFSLSCRLIRFNASKQVNVKNCIALIIKSEIKECISTTFQWSYKDQKNTNNNSVKNACEHVGWTPHKAIRV